MIYSLCMILVYAFGGVWKFRGEEAERGRQRARQRELRAWNRRALLPPKPGHAKTLVGKTVPDRRDRVVELHGVSPRDGQV